MTQKQVLSLEKVDCPVLRPDIGAHFRSLRKDAGAFSMRFAEYLSDLSQPQRVAWIRTALAGTKTLFQPWTLEVLYGIAVLGTARFGELESWLEIPTKTLSVRLRSLQEQGMVERRLVDDRPPRADYRLTKAGRATAALASPLFTHLAHEAKA